MFEGPEKAAYADNESCISEESFDRQMQETQKVEVDGGVLEYVAIHPEKLSGDDPVLFVGGFGQGPATYTDEMYDLCQAGRKVVFVNPRKGFELDESDDFHELSDTFGVSETVLAKVKELELILDNEQMRNVALAGHSQGGLVLTALAAHRPDLANNLILQNTQGFQGDMSTFDLFKKFRGQLISQFKDNRDEKEVGNTRPDEAGKRAGLSFAKEFLHNPVWRLQHEVPGSAKVDILPMLEHIKEQREESGVGPQITLLNAQNDGLFEPEMYEQGLEVDPNASDEEILQKYDEIFKYVDSWATFSRKGAGHNAPATEEPGLLRQILENSK